MGEATPEDQAAAIRRELFAGNKIAAIKIYREQTKVGLAEAKTAVEALEAELRKTSPESFTRAASKGCSMEVLAIAAMIVTLLAVLRNFHVI